MIPANMSSFVRGAELDELNLPIVLAPVYSAKREMSDSAAHQQIAVHPPLTLKLIIIINKSTAL